MSDKSKTGSAANSKTGDAPVLRLTDEEVICEFMEAKPEAFLATGSQAHPSVGGWWRSDFRFTSPSPNDGEYYWKPRKLTLDALHEVEARLTDEHWKEYCWRFQRGGMCSWWENQRDFLHASAEQKIKALASILRPIVEAR